MLQLFPFLSSTRFWALVLLGLAIWFSQIGWIPVQLAEFIELVCGGHIGLRSLDRATEVLANKKK